MDFLKKLSNNKIKLGDTISLFLNEKFIARGVLWINAPIPLGRFYNRIYGNEKHCNSEDIYENAIVIKDEKNFDNLIVLTLENNDFKLFLWNDLINDDNHFNYRIIKESDCLEIIHDDITLVEVNLHKR